jgi:leader peptidase (prepilin peptidase)/N-methyltransferase
MDPDQVAALESLAVGMWGHLLAFWFGALLGSFANVCIARVPLRMSVVKPPSHCFACKAPVAWYDNIPIVSYFLLRGACRRCGARYSVRYMFVEAATGLLFAATWHLCLIALHPDEPLTMRVARFCIYALLVVVLVVIAFIDLDTMTIPDRISYPAIPAFYLLGLASRDVAWWQGLVGIAVGYGTVRVIADGY